MTNKEKMIDESLEMTFPASDPPAVGTPTGTEEPLRPMDRTAAVIPKADIDAAAGMDEDGEARERHHGLGREGIKPSDGVDGQSDEQGLGREGVASDTGS